MAVDMFLWVKGEVIKGESKDKIYSAKKAIDVLAYSWGVSQSGTFHGGGGGGAGKANFQDVSITSWMDAATVQFIQACGKGTHIDEMTLVCRKAGDKPLEFFTAVMKNCLVSSVSIGGSGGEDRQTANVSLNFAIVELKYVEQDAKGKDKPPVEFKYNIQENADA